MSKELIIIGAGGQARVIIDAAENVGFKVCGVIDINFKGQNEKICCYPVLGNISVLDTLNPDKTDLAIAIGDGKQRADYFYKLTKLGHKSHFSFSRII